MRMEERKLTCLKEKEEIFNVLQTFAPFLNSLQQGEIYQREMAEKFSKNAEFYLLSMQECYVGFIAFYANDRVNHVAYLSMVAVSDGYRRLGIGQTLLSVCMEKAKENGMKTLQLEVRKNNATALSFYQKNGFKTFSETENSYYMKKNLTE